MVEGKKTHATADRSWAGLRACVKFGPTPRRDRQRRVMRSGDLRNGCLQTVRPSAKSKSASGSRNYATLDENYLISRGGTSLRSARGNLPVSHWGQPRG